MYILTIAIRYWPGRARTTFFFIVNEHEDLYIGGRAPNLDTSQSSK